jgi:hypothetical protein
MVLGMSLATFTLVHVVISLIGIFTGLVVLAGMLRSQRLPGWTAVFLVTTILTSVTGFFFPFEKLLPSHIFGIISLVVLAAALFALYVARLSGRSRWVYVATAVFALYLNVFVLVVQIFVKIPFFKALAPTQGEPPFAIAQGIVLLAFLFLGYRAVRSFHPERGGFAMRPA